MSEPRPYVGTGTVATIRAAKRRGQATAAAIGFTDAYTCYTVNRPAGWADGTDVEAVGVVESGTGRLRANGTGGPTTGEMVISLESPYTFRTVAAATIAAGHLLVLNDARLFRVDVVKREDGDDLLMTVALTELFQTPLPEIG